MLKEMADAKYKVLLAELKAEILSGKYGHGQKMPSESALVRRTGFSRITVSRALHELHVAGLVQRVAGSGTFAIGPGELHEKAFLFGLLMPELGKTEILAPLCRAIADAPGAKAHALLWGNAGAGTPEQQTIALANQLIERGVDGVFFAPLEYGSNVHAINRRVMRMLQKAKVAVVLVDRRIPGLPGRAWPDLAGLNHMHAARQATEYLLQRGCKRLAFVSNASTASSVTDRQAGFEQTIREHKKAVAAKVFDLPSGSARLRRWLGNQAAGLVCVNDEVAGHVLRLLQALEIKVPGQVQVTGVDDAGYATMLSVPLTTVRQPLAAIGEAAMQLMVERLTNLARPGRALLLDGELIVRGTTAVHAIQPDAKHSKGRDPLR
ncbi:MAG: substrate-binding domain-containing protein [Terriglobus sp.]